MTVSPITTAARVVEEASNEALLDVIVRLTHRIHRTTDVQRADELRVQRAIARAEVLRRMGGTR